MTGIWHGKYLISNPSIHQRSWREHDELYVCAYGHRHPSPRAKVRRKQKKNSMQSLIWFISLVPFHSFHLGSWASFRDRRYRGKNTSRIHSFHRTNHKKKKENQTNPPPHPLMPIHDSLFVPFDPLFFPFPSFHWFPFLFTFLLLIPFRSFPFPFPFLSYDSLSLFTFHPSISQSPSSFPFIIDSFFIRDPGRRVRDHRRDRHRRRDRRVDTCRVSGAVAGRCARAIAAASASRRADHARPSPRATSPHPTGSSPRGNARPCSSVRCCRPRRGWRYGAAARCSSYFSFPSHLHVHDGCCCCCC